MIPAIETIVEDLAAGVIAKQQAIAWLYQHTEDAANDLRDHFAAMAMQGLMARIGAHEASIVAHDAYIVADEMINARSETN